MNRKQFDYIETVKDLIYSVLDTPLLINSDFDFEVVTFIACQSALETSYGTSEVFKINRNYFGMRFPKVRPTLSSRQNLNHAWYRCFHCSFIDYYYWCIWNHFPDRCFSNLSEFVAYLELSSFNPSKTYCKTILSIVESYKNFEK